MNEVLDLKARTKRLAKSLRQVADLRGRELKDDAQRAKAARGPALEAELAYAEARLAELQRAVDDAVASNGVAETAVEGAAGETDAAADADVGNDGADAETAGADADADSAGDDPDAADDDDDGDDGDDASRASRRGRGGRRDLAKTTTNDGGDARGIASIARDASDGDG